MPTQGAILFVKFPIPKSVLYNKTMTILPDNEFYSFEDRDYIQPQVSLDEQNRFIDNLRGVQSANNQQIATQTYNLGSALPSNLGGLMGGAGYWKSRYQTPQTNTLVNDLRTAAQAKALNDVLANEQAKMQKRYNAAYRASQIRGSNPSAQKGGVEHEDNTKELNVKDRGTVTNVGLQSGASRIAYSLDDYIYTYDTLANGASGITYTDDPSYSRGSDGFYHKTHTISDSLGNYIKTANPSFGNPLIKLDMDLRQGKVFNNE